MARALAGDHCHSETDRWAFWNRRRQMKNRCHSVKECILSVSNRPQNIGFVPRRPIIIYFPLICYDLNASPFSESGFYSATFNVQLFN